MISLTPLIQLISVKPNDFDGLWFREVGGAAKFAQIRPDALPLPAAWVVRAADKVAHAGERAERVSLAFDVVIAIENERSHSKGDTDDALLHYRLAVKKMLLGWQISPNVKPIKFAGGQVLEYTDGDLYWRDRYEFDALITNYLPVPQSFTEISNPDVDNGNQL